MKKSNLVCAVAIGILLAVSASANDDAIVKQARELQIAKKYDEALKIYEENTKTTASEKLYVDYASLLINLSKFSECEEMLTKAVEAYPDSLRIKNALGMAKYKQGKKSEASSLFSQVIGKDADNTFAKNMMETIRKENVAAMTPAVDDNAVSGSDSEGFDDSSSDSSSGGTTFNVSNDLSLDEQKALAKDLYSQMVALDKWDTDSFVDLHRKVIEKCPLTDQAQESCWRLSNLYLLGMEPVQYDNCIAVLEHLLKQYPDTPLMPDAKNRILVVAQQTGDYNRVIALYEELFQRDPEPDDKTFMVRALEYGNALAAAGKAEEAKQWYIRVVERDGGKGQLEARAAAVKMSELQ